MATYHQQSDVPVAGLSVRPALPDRRTHDLRVCVEVGEDLVIYFTAVEWAALADMADAAFELATKRAGQKEGAPS